MLITPTDRPKSVLVTSLCNLLTQFLMVTRFSFSLQKHKTWDTRTSIFIYAVHDCCKKKSNFVLFCQSTNIINILINNKMQINVICLLWQSTSISYGYLCIYVRYHIKSGEYTLYLKWFLFLNHGRRTHPLFRVRIKNTRQRHGNYHQRVVARAYEHRLKIYLL